MLSFRTERLELDERYKLNLPKKAFPRWTHSPPPLSLILGLWDERRGILCMSRQANKKRVYTVEKFTEILPLMPLIPLMMPRK